MFLCVAAFLVPALILRETSVLEVPREDLARLTPVGRDEILRRQGVAQTWGRAAPFVGTVLLACGGLLIAFGAPGLRKREEAEDARSSAELNKLRAELKPQTDEELQEGLRWEVTDDVRGEGAPVDSAEPKAHTQDPDQSPPRRALADRMARARAVEERVLARLAEVAPPLYELQQRGGAPTAN